MEHKVDIRLDECFIGYSVSHGTLKTEDLLEAFYNFLERKSNILIQEIEDAYQITPETDFERVVKRNPTVAQFLLEDLIEAINEIAPTGSYFGAHVGDGSDFGFWRIEED